MNRVSDAIVRRDPDPEDFFVIDKTNAATIDQDVSSVLYPSPFNDFSSAWTELLELPEW